VKRDRLGHQIDGLPTTLNGDSHATDGLAGTR
jgi:hypothetical protein